MIPLYSGDCSSCRYALSVDRITVLTLVAIDLWVMAPITSSFSIPLRRIVISPIWQKALMNSISFWRKTISIGLCYVLVFLSSVMQCPLQLIDMRMLMFACDFSAGNRTRLIRHAGCLGNQGIRVLADSINSVTPTMVLTITIS